MQLLTDQASPETITEFQGIESKAIELAEQGFITEVPRFEESVSSVELMDALWANLYTQEFALYEPDWLISIDNLRRDYGHQVATDLQTRLDDIREQKEGETFGPPRSPRDGL